VYDDDEELQKLTKTNTEFNMNNGNLLGDPTVNIKRSFAALKLGAPQKDATGKKQTLKISVTPFSGNSSSTSMPSLKLDIKSKLPSNDSSNDKKSDKSKNNGIILKSITHTSDESFSTIKPKVSASEALNDEVDKSPTDFDVKLATSSEKSLLEEINETLLSKKILVNEANATQSMPTKVVEETTKNDVIKVIFIAIIIFY